MSVFKSTGIVLLIVLAFLFYTGTFIVDEREKALVMRFGDINRIVESPGLYFKIPIADTIVPIEDRLVMWTSPDKSVQVIDGRRAGGARRRAGTRQPADQQARRGRGERQDPEPAGRGHAGEGTPWAGRRGKSPRPRAFVSASMCWPIQAL